MGNGYDRLVLKMTDEELLSHARHYQTYQEELLMAIMAEAKSRGLSLANEVEMNAAVEAFLEKERLAAEAEQKEAEEQAAEDTEQISEEVLPVLYSQTAVLAFSLFFSPVAGSILLAINLKKLQRRGVGQVLIFGLVLALAQGFINMQVPPDSIISILTHVAGALLLSELMWNQFIGRRYLYKRRSILIPLIIAVAIVAPVAWYLYQHPDLMEQIQNGTYE